MGRFWIAAALALAAAGGTLMDDEIAASISRIEALAAKETIWPRIATLSHAADLLKSAAPAKAGQLRALAASLRDRHAGTMPAPLVANRKRLAEAVAAGDRIAIESAAEEFLNAVEHSKENPEDYEWFAALRRRHDIVKGSDNASVRVREALANLSELVRTDFDFEVSDLAGSDIRLRPDGRWTVLSFWASWCGPCVEELPMMDRVSRMFKAVRFVAITDEPAETVTEFLARHPLSFAACIDARRAAFNRYGVDALPALVVVDGTGRTRFTALRTSEEELTSILRKLIAP